jgi:uncharacterized protein with HEPN domain
VKDERLYLEDLLSRIAMIEEFTVEGREDFMTSLKTQEAVIRCFEVIGEIAKRLPADQLAEHPHIPWKQLVGFRDFLIHNYARVKLDIVWKAVQDDLQPLKTAAQAIMQTLDEEDGTQNAE